MVNRTNKDVEKIKTSLFGHGPSKNPTHSENKSTDIIDESSDVVECSSNTVIVHFNCFSGKQVYIQYDTTDANSEQLMVTI
jgi:hypothetical protein